MEDIKLLIQQCVKGERQSQNQLYNIFCEKMFVTCLRYSSNRQDAEDTLQEGFTKVFEFLHQYKFTGSFEGWIRKIIVNCALQKFRRKQQLHAVVNIETTSAHELGNEDIISQIGAKEVLKMVQQGMFISLIFALSGFIGCKKENGINTVVTASTTQATVGQTVSLQVTTSMNAVSWTVTPSTTAITQYSITDQKTNTVTFTQPGVYTVGVRARDIAFDASHQKLDSCWHHGGGDHGTCMHGRDSSSVSIKVF